MHRVFPSSRPLSASARTVQFHRGQGGDSEGVVTPFMHVGTYPTRNFATLGPSELRPPFAGGSDRGGNLSPSPSSTGQMSVPLHPLTSLQRPVFLVNSRSLLLRATRKNMRVSSYLSKHSFFRSYRASLPSSFSLLLSRAVVYSTGPPVSV